MRGREGLANLSGSRQKLHFLRWVRSQLELQAVQMLPESFATLAATPPGSIPCIRAGGLRPPANLCDPSGIKTAMENRCPHDPASRSASTAGLLFSAQSGLTLLREKWLGSFETGGTSPRRAEKVAFRSAKSSWARPRGAELECWRQPLFAERKATFSARLGFQNRRWGGVGRIGKSVFRDVSLPSTSSITRFRIRRLTPTGSPFSPILVIPI